MANETIRVITEKENIVAIADAVRSKTGSTDEMTLDGIVSGINSIETGANTSIETGMLTITNNFGIFDFFVPIISENDTIAIQHVKTDLWAGTTQATIENVLLYTPIIMVQPNTRFDDGMPRELNTLTEYSATLSGVINYSWMNYVRIFYMTSSTGRISFG